MSKLASLLGGMTLNDLAKEVLSLQGRRGDTELAHVNKREAALLKQQGGSGTINSSTGMPEFYDGYEGMDFTGSPEQMQAFDTYGQQPDISTVYLPDTRIPEVNVTQTPFQEQYGQSIFAGQPTPQVAGGQMSPTTPEISGFPEGLTYEPGPGYATGRLPGAGVQDVLGFTEGVGTQAGVQPPAQEPGIMDRLKAFEQWAKENPQLARGIGAAAGGIPGLMASRKARQDAERTRREMEQMAAPIRQAGEAQLSAGQRGELTAPQQQAIEAARAASKQDLVRRGVTSGTAAQQAENRITELAQRFAQDNINNGVRLIGAANSYNAAAIQQAYRMNQDANALTQSYFQNLMRAYGALPTETVTTTRNV